MDRLILGVYLAAVVGTGIAGSRRRRPGLEDYVLAGRTLTLPMFVASLVTSFYGGVLGVGEFSWRHGLVNWVAMGVPYYLFAALYAAFLAGRVRVSPGMTIPDHLESAYGRGMAVFAAFLVFLLVSPADELLMLGTLLQWGTGLSLPVCTVAVAVLALVYMVRGGLRADVWTNRVEFVFMFGGFALILPFAWFKLGGLEYLRASLPPAHLTAHGGLSAVHIATWYFIAVWTLVDPMFHQRACAATDPLTARRGIAVSILFWCLFDAMTTTAGLYARAALPELENPLQAFPALAERVLPAGARALFLIGMMSSMLAALDGAVLLSAVALAKDGLGRWKGAPEAEQERWVSWAIPLVGVAGAAGALWIPSVVGLWYAVGSTVIPGLLLPLLGAYFPALRVRPAAALAASASGWGLSTGWFLAGQASGHPPLGIEPMFPGLAVSCLIWLAGLKR